MELSFLKRNLFFASFFMVAFLLTSCGNTDNGIILPDEGKAQIDPTVLTGTWRLTKIVSTWSHRDAEPDEMLIVIDESTHQMMVDNVHSAEIKIAEEKNWQYFNTGYFIPTGEYIYDELKKSISGDHNKEIDTTISIKDYKWELRQVNGILIITDGMAFDTPYYYFEKIK